MTAVDVCVSYGALRYINGLLNQFWRTHFCGNAKPNPNVHYTAGLVCVGRAEIGAVWRPCQSKTRSGQASEHSGKFLGRADQSSVSPNLIPDSTYTNEQNILMG